MLFSFATLRARLAMRSAFKPSFFVIAAAVLGVVALPGCGNSVPAGAVAKVGDTTITQDQFDKWMNIAVSGQSQAPGGASAAPDPPDFEKCVAAKKKTPVPKGQQKPSDDALKKQCKSEYEQLKKEVMQFLIQAEWVVQEADKRNIKVKPAEVQKALEDQKKQVFPNEKQYQQFLKNSGMTEEDVLFRVRLNELNQRLQQDALEEAPKVTDEDVTNYYEKHKNNFAQPERRDLRVVLTKTRSKAARAKKELQSGQPFKTVVKKYSIDEASKSQNGLLPAVAKGQEDAEFDTAIFEAPKNVLRGPIKTQFGWYVFRVEKVTKASQQSLEESKDTIRNLLRSTRQRKAAVQFVKQFRKDYKEQTHCADDYRIAECENAPKDESATGPASGGNPQQPAQPQQPSQPTPQDQQP
jgi:foldase protein PrsA